MRRTRNTSQRKAVLQAVQALSGHPSAADVFARVRADYPHLSLATVYRALHALVECGEITVMRVDAVTRYDAGLPCHHHVVCRGCGAIVDVPAVLPRALMEGVALVSGFLLDPHPVQFSGLCCCCAGHPTALPSPEQPARK